MDNRIMRLIIALGKFSAQPRQYRIMEGLNASETGVFLGNDADYCGKTRYRAVRTERA